MNKNLHVHLMSAVLFHLNLHRLFEILNIKVSPLIAHFTKHVKSILLKSSLCELDNVCSQTFRTIYQCNFFFEVKYCELFPRQTLVKDSLYRM